MVALFSDQRRNLSFSPAKEALSDDHRSSSSFFTGNSSSSSLSHREKFSSLFTEVIPSLLLSSFKRDKGMVSARESYHLKRQRRVGRGPLGTLLSLVESRVFLCNIYIGDTGYFRSCKALIDSTLQNYGNNRFPTLLPNFSRPFTSVLSLFGGLDGEK